MISYYTMMIEVEVVMSDKVLVSLVGTYNKRRIGKANDTYVFFIVAFSAYRFLFNNLARKPCTFWAKADRSCAIRASLRRLCM
jgi:hypothetical protein